MFPHSFTDNGATYMVSFRRSGDQLRVALYRREDATLRELPAFLPEEVALFSAEAIRAGYIGLAEWLVKCEAFRTAVADVQLRAAAA
jgi:hypothetical protein